MIDFEEFKKIADENVKRLINVDGTQTYLLLGKSKITYKFGLYSVIKNGSIICSDIVNYDIALLIAEDKLSVSEAIILDNEYYKHYNDILLNKRFDNCINDAKTIESIIKLSNVLKSIKSKKSLSTYFDKYKK